MPSFKSRTSAYIHNRSNMIENQEPAYWFVGAALGASEDKTDEFVCEGAWRYWPDPDKPEQYRDKILAMKPGDRIAIKAAYVRKHKLPFDNWGYPVSVMGIKAIGEVTGNPGDGKTVKVHWQERFDPPREWYFYTTRFSVWKLNMESWRARALAAFAFEGQEQDFRTFRNDPYWQSRFGDIERTDTRFSWAAFYQAFASQLLAFQECRDELVAGLRELSEKAQVPNIKYFYEKDDQGTPWFIKDICPFTLMGTFNRGGTNENRRIIAAALARLIGLDHLVPEDFDGIPVLNPQRSWFFAAEGERYSKDIDHLWAVFRAAITYADAEKEDSELREEVAKCYDQAIAQKGVGWNLSIGLYWIRPWRFLPLDQHTRAYVQKHYGLTLPSNHNYQKLSGADYMGMIDNLQEKLEEQEGLTPSFPEISLAAWSGENSHDRNKQDRNSLILDTESFDDMPQPYSLDDVIEEGAFMAQSDLDRMLQRLKEKKNIILQGAPGTGKTWLSQKVAYALIGFRAESNLFPLQFHPTLSYEDFVRGWRPAFGGKLDLVDGPFMQAINRAKENPEWRYVVVIEEINRGNPAQIFGEMLTLLEGDKRSKEYGMRLSHMREGEGSVYVPPNLYIVGTMNIADRSLALVDLALRRRFAFFDLEPQLNEAWVKWVVQNGWFQEDRVRDIQARIHSLNEVIENDETLGPQFRVGHSYVTPRPGGHIRSDVRHWFKDVATTEIQPLLDEYWFDRPDKAHQQVKKLLEDW